MVERFELAIQSCQAITNGLSTVPSAGEIVTEYKEILISLSSYFECY